MELPTIVTLFVDQAGQTRVSRVTAHGEELIQPDLETAAICAGIYRQLAGGTPSGPTDIARLKESIAEAAQAIERARAASVEPLVHAARITQDLGAVLAQLDRIEHHLTTQLWTADTIKGWLEQVYLRNPIVLKEIRGQ
jgi:hypothetical protein